MYENTYYEEVIKMCQDHIDIIETLHDQTIKIAINETQTSKENND